MIEPRFGKYEGAGEAKLEEATPQQKKGLNAAALTAIIYIIIIAIGFFTGLLSGENGAFIGSPLLKGPDPDPVRSVLSLRSCIRLHCRYIQERC